MNFDITPYIIEQLTKIGYAVAGAVVIISITTLLIYWVLI